MESIEFIYRLTLLTILLWIGHGIHSPDRRSEANHTINGLMVVLSGILMLVFIVAYIVS